MFEGDLEHTHLVKGLDYALLNKVRSEIDKKPDSEDATEGKPRYMYFQVRRQHFIVICWLFA